MRVLIINTSERIGGAAIAANRLMEALKNNGIKAKMLVRSKQTEQISVVELKKSWWKVWQFIWERIVIWKANHFKKHNIFAVDIANTGTNISQLPEFTQADIIHLHWINQGMLSLTDIRRIIDSGKPIVWTMHDMWPFTGICHYAGNCDKYMTECYHCPLLYKGGKKDLSYRTFQKKRNLFDGAHITFVACSRWLEAMAKQSELLKGQQITNVPNAINTNLFKPRSKQQAREKCHLPQDKKLLLFGSVKLTDKRKGIDYLVEACKILATQNSELSKQLGVVVFGKQAEQYASLFPFPIYPMNYVSNEKELVDIYNAVDLYVTPSLQDNLPNTIVEAMACGIPCVGFNVGGIPQMIDHLHNGYVAEYQSSKDLANGIQWALADKEEYKTLSEEACRKAISSYSESIISKKYIDIYNKITENHA
ncbi:glycosyltransferase family 4 protein [Phocaeicola sp.]